MKLLNEMINDILNNIAKFGSHVDTFRIHVKYAVFFNNIKIVILLANCLIYHRYKILFDNEKNSRCYITIALIVSP